MYWIGYFLIIGFVVIEVDMVVFVGDYFIVVELGE